jgi:hypothetical protein
MRYSFSLAYFLGDGLSIAANDNLFGLYPLARVTAHVNLNGTFPSPVRPSREQTAQARSNGRQPAEPMVAAWTSTGSRDLMGWIWIGAKRGMMIAVRFEFTAKFSRHVQFAPDGSVEQVTEKCYKLARIAKGTTDESARTVCRINFTRW